MALQHSRSRPIGNQGGIDETAWRAGERVLKGNTIVGPGTLDGRRRSESECARQSTLAPDAFTIAAHLGISDLM
jgi:hypothetical protein